MYKLNFEILKWHANKKNITSNPIILVMFMQRKQNQ